jgi:hypothetical protein
MSPRTAFHHSQPRPDRRYRRLLPTALAVASLAAGGATLGAPTARAAASPPPPPRLKTAPRTSRAAVVPRVPRRRDGGAQDVTST